MTDREIDDLAWSAYRRLLQVTELLTRFSEDTGREAETLEEAEQWRIEKGPLIEIPIIPRAGLHLPDEDEPNYRLVFCAEEDQKKRKKAERARAKRIEKRRQQEEDDKKLSPEALKYIKALREVVKLLPTVPPQEWSRNRWLEGKMYREIINSRLRHFIEADVRFDSKDGSETGGNP